MKKFFRIIVTLFAVLLIAIVALPIAFKGKIINAIKAAANEQLTAVLAFDDVSVSLIRDFPNLNVRIDQLSLTGTGVFDGVQLLSAERIGVTIDLMSILGDTIALRDILIESPSIDVRVLADGTANYDIMKPAADSEQAEEQGDSTASFAMNLRRYSISNGAVHYDDATFPMRLDIEGLNHSGAGDFTLDVFTLQTSTSASRIDVVYDGVKYLREAKADLTAGIEIDNRTSTYSFKENVLMLNRLPLKANGWVAMPADDIGIDLSFSSSGGDLVALMSLIPAEFASDLEGVEASGSMAFNGFVKGTYNENTMPGFGLNLDIRNGRFHYPDLPESAENIEIRMRVDATEGIDNDAMTLDVDRFYLELANNPIDLRLKVRNPYSDPYVEADALAKIDFAKLAEVVPLEEGDQMAGNLNANIHFKGRMSALDEARYDDVECSGELIVLDTRFESESTNDAVEVSACYFRFSPQYAQLTQLDAQIGDADLNAEGRIDNYIQYFVRDELLHGQFKAKSRYFDLNAFMDADEEANENNAEAEIESQPLGVIRLPKNVDFTLDARFDKLHYGSYDISNAQGSMVIREGVVELRDMNLSMLDGVITANGSYDSRSEDPLLDMDFALKRIDIQEAVNTFYTIEKMAPIAKSTTGKVTTTLGLRCTLNQEMMPIEETITGGGKLQTSQIHIEKFEPLNKVAAELGIDRLAKQTINDVNFTYRFENGRVGVDPFTVQLEGIETTIDGSMSFSQELDYNVKMIVPVSALPANISGTASSLLTDINQRFGSNLSVGTKLPMMLKITGTVTNPVVKGNYGEALKEQKETLKEQVKEQIKEVIEDKIDDAKEAAIARARAEADKIISDAQKRADRMVADATSAANSVRNTAYNEAQRIEDSAKNPIERVAKKTAADKLRKEADDAHKRAIDEAKKQANAIMNEANTRADNLIREAENQ